MERGAAELSSIAAAESVETLSEMERGSVRIMPLNPTKAPRAINLIAEA